MIRVLLVLLAGLGIGYSYGYLQGDAGEDSIIRVALAKVGLDHVVDGARGRVRRTRAAEGRRQVVIDSMRQARADSVSSLIHH